jgi:hypothetical protein
MEQITSNLSVEMFTLDLEELDKFISQSTRPNLKRQFEQYRNTIALSLAEEKKKLEKTSQSQKENSSVAEVSNSTLNFITVSKYALDSGEKFVK